jgi:Kef-type K+ transport system membrane component KefB
MTPFLQLILALAILIAAAKIGGWLSQKLNQPSVLGELLVGVLLGPTFLNLLHLPYFTDEHLPDFIDHAAEIGVLLLMFFAGLEIDLGEMLRAGKVALLAGVMGVIAPLILGPLTAIPFGYDTNAAIFIGVILTATSVSISAQTLMELGMLKSKTGVALLGAAVVDDVLGIVVLSLFVAVAGGAATGGAGAFALVLVKMAAFLAISIFVGLRFLPRITHWVDRLPIIEGTLAFVVVMMFLFSWAAEALGGVAAITGAFIAGVALARTGSHLKHKIEEGVRPLTYGFFVPLFFVGIGLETNARDIPVNLIPFVILILLVAIISKVIGCGLAGLVGGFSRREALQLGVGMVSRGEVGLIVASVGINNGIIGSDVFAVTVIVVLITTLVTPLLLRLAFRSDPTAPTAAPSA